MATKTTTAISPEDDTAEEIIGILTAISVVSKRLAKKLWLEQATEHKEGGNPDEQDECEGQGTAERGAGDNSGG